MVDLIWSRELDKLKRTNWICLCIFVVKCVQVYYLFVHVNTDKTDILLEKCFLVYVEWSLDTVISTTEATSTFYVSTKALPPFSLTETHLSWSLRCTADLWISEELMVEPILWEAVFTVQGIRWKSEPYCPENLNIRGIMCRCTWKSVPALPKAMHNHCRAHVDATAPWLEGGGVSGLT